MNKTQKNQSIKALQRALKIVGSQRKLAKLIPGKKNEPLKQQNITYWLKSGVPAHHAIHIQDATQGAVTIFDIRPDFLGKKQ